MPSPQPAPPHSPAARDKTMVLMLAYLAFILLGLPVGLLGVAWPTMRVDYGRSLEAMGALLVASTTGYVLSSFFIARLIARFGISSLLIFSSLASAAAMLVYSLAPAWGVLVGISLLAGFGGGLLDAGLNTYLAAEYQESEMQWLHACFGIGATLSPLIMTLSLSRLASWRPGYLLVGVVTAAITGAFALTYRAWQAPRPAADLTAAEGAVGPGLMDYQTSLRDSLRHPLTWVGILLFLLYTGAEFTLGNWTYSILTEGRGLSPQLAGLWAGGFWATFTVGRILGGLFAHRVRLNTLMVGAMSLALVGALLFWWNPLLWVGILGIGVTGFAMAPIFAGLISSTQQRVGERHAANTIGIQMSAANLGGALVPTLAGALAQRLSLETIPLILVISLVSLLALYALSSRIRTPGQP